MLEVQDLPDELLTLHGSPVIRRASMGYVTVEFAGNTYRMLRPREYEGYMDRFYVVVMFEGHKYRICFVNADIVD